MPVTYSLINDAGGKFSLTGNVVKVAAALTAGVSTITIRAVDSNGWTKDANIDITAFVSSVLAISGEPAAAAVGNSTPFAPVITGGTAPYTLSLLSGALPGGRAVNGAANTVTGTYTTAGTFNYTLRVTDAVGATADLPVTMTVATATVALDPPVTTAMVSRTLVAIGFDRMVQGQTGNTVQLKELTGNTTRDFGFDANGYFDMAGVIAWQATADLDIVQFYNGIGGAAIAVTGTAALRRSGVVRRLGTIFNPTTGQLTLDPTNGGVAANMGSISHISIPLTGVDINAGNLEMHLLWSNNKRKIGSGDVTDTVAGGDSSTEAIIAYGTTSTNRFYWSLGGAAVGTSRSQTGATGSDFVTANYVPFSNAANRWKKYVQNVTSHIVSKTALKSNGFGRQSQATATAANTQTAIAAGNLNNGIVVIGGNFASATVGAVTTTAGARLDGAFAGCIVTAALTDAERYQLQAKMNLIGQQHRAKSSATILGYYDEWFFMKDVDASGNVAGRNGLATLAFNKGAPSTTWDFAYIIPNVGVQGIRSPAFSLDNKFMANNRYFAGVVTGAILSMHYNEQTSNELHYTIGRESEAYNGALTGRANLAIGYDHNASGFISRWGIAKDTESLFIGRQKEFPSDPSGYKAWGAAIYEGQSVSGSAGANQAMGKYNVNTPHNSFKYDETIYDSDLGGGSPFTGSQAWWEGTLSMPYKLDAPVFRPVAENSPAPFRNDCLMLHQVNFKAPTGYDPAASYATRKAQRLTGSVTSYLSAGSSPVTHMDGAVAVNNNAGVADGNADDRLQSFAFSGSPGKGFSGTRVAFAFKANANLTQTQVEEVAVNMYKITP